MKNRTRIFFVIFVSIVILLCAMIPMLGFTVSIGSDVGYSREFSELFTKTFLANVTDSEIEIKDVQDVYSFNETVYGSKVSFHNTETNKDGYIIFSIDGHINEYSLDGESESLSNKENKLYYNGNHEYFSKTKSGEYLDRFGTKIKNFENVEKKYFNNKLIETLYINAKNAYGSGEVIEDPTSVIPSSRTIINYEHKDIDNYDVGYFSTALIKNHDNHCGPVAVLNCIIYFAENGYPDLVPDVSGRYFYVFEEICKLMNFKDNGATPAKQRDGLYKYINSIYSGQFKKHTDYYITYSDVTKRVNENVPFIYTVSGHSMYEDHSLVGLGYHKYECTYKNSSGKTCSETNMFLRVADGWGGDASERFINYADAKTRSIVWVTHN